MRNIFVEKPSTKCDGETVLRPFSKKPKLSIPLHQNCKVLYSLLLLYAKFRITKIYSGPAPSISKWGEGARARKV